MFLNPLIVEYWSNVTCFKHSSLISNSRRILTNENTFCKIKFFFSFLFFRKNWSSFDDSPKTRGWNRRWKLNLVGKRWPTNSRDEIWLTARHVGSRWKITAAMTAFFYRFLSRIAFFLFDGDRSRLRIWSGRVPPRKEQNIYQFLFSAFLSIPDTWAHYLLRKPSILLLVGPTCLLSSFLSFVFQFCRNYLFNIHERHR